MDSSCREAAVPDRSTVRFTYRDYLALPEPVPYRRHEIVDGELVVSAAPRSRHQEVVMNLAALLHQLSRSHGLGKVFPSPITVRLHDEGVVQPDVIFVAADRLRIVDPDGDVHGVPDLVVEVLSPSTRELDRGPKRKQYMSSGVPELWIVDAEEREVEVWRPGAEEPEVVRDALVWEAGGRRRFEIPLEEVFRGVSGRRPS